MNDGDLEFFVAELWEPSFSLLETLKLDVGLLMSNLYPVELSVWLQFGADIGFFDARRVKAILKNKSPQLDVCRAALPKELLEQIAYRNLAAGFVGAHRLNSMFRHHMLMTAELMSNQGAVVFLETLIAFEGDQWQSVLDGNTVWLGSLELVCGGFGRVLSHLEFSPVLHTETGDEYLLNKVLCEFQTARLGLRNAGETFRYFEFAGAILAQYELPSDRIDLERAIFQEIYETFAGWRRIVGAEIATLKFEECWHAFVGKHSELKAKAGMRLRSMP